jgi:pre-mRNA cleavage complex 2 protein Pcf11
MQLYKVGLPFVCSADGRRFATLLELSRHLDVLFFSNQLEKTMERMEEHGLYSDVGAWSSGADTASTALSLLLSSLLSASTKKSRSNVPGGSRARGALAGGGPAESTTIVANEAHNRCMLCGISFAMFFDQDDVEWNYMNCKEINVEDKGPLMDVEELEPVLVHFMCWEGLGSPRFLLPDQIHHAV